MASDSCEHIQRYKKENGVYSYEILHAFYVSCIAKESRKRKADDCICRVVPCKTKSIRVHACLSCVFFGCFIEQHIHTHAEKSKHLLAVDTNFGFVYCFECKDYKYDDDFEKISHRNKLLATVHLETYKWKPNPATAKLLQKYHVFELGQSGIRPRGIVNMGQTCYISAILQSLVHAPVIRDYFLSGRHRCHIRKKSESQNQSSELENSSVCFVCEMSSIVQEFFCGKLEPYIPNSFLYSFWNRVPSLSGYKQQDAHEFLLEFLNIMHQHSIGTNGHVSSCKYHDDSIIDAVFTGFLQNEIICLECKHKSTKVDTFRDISLNLGNHAETLPKSSVGRKNGSSVSVTLAMCLERFVEKECISSRSCDICKATSNEESLKEISEESGGTNSNNDPVCSMQTTIKKLPIIISFQLKRSVGSSKVTEYIEFPEFLDMTPYMSSGKADAYSNKFYLFAVVCHKGGASGGHYYSYVRQHKTKWFSCDDVSVSSCLLETIQGESNFAYLLFYHKQFLEYEQKPERGERCITNEMM